MKKFMVFAVVGAFIFAGSAVFADNTGCGLGTTLLKGKKGKVFEVLAVTTNGTCANQTFAITSGTLEYEEGAVIGMNKEVQSFVAQNMDSLATDMAKGEGEYLDALASLMKVDNRMAFKFKMRYNFNKIYTSEEITSTEVVENIYRVVNS